MLNAILPLISVALGLSTAAPDRADGRGEQTVTITAPRTAQVELAVTLAEADAIHAVSADAKNGTITFAIDRDGDAFEVVARISRRSHEVIALTITDVGGASAARSGEPGRAAPPQAVRRSIDVGDVGGLTWLGAELADATAVIALAVDEDGAVTITTSDGRSYMAIPGRGSGGNAGVEARWAAAWNSDEG